jgi:hypothetical protein
MVPDVSKNCITIFKGNLTMKMKAQSFRTSGITHSNKIQSYPNRLESPDTQENLEVPS